MTRSSSTRSRRNTNPTFSGWTPAGWARALSSCRFNADWATAHRKINPQQLWVNRDGDVVEDYLTPENPPPSSLTKTGLGLRPKPWEVCMTLGEKWAYNPHDVYKSTKTVVQTLVSVVATGGSLLLDIGPMPTGELPPTALSRLAEVGKWMDVNAEAIHGTVPHWAPEFGGRKWIPKVQDWLSQNGGVWFSWKSYGICTPHSNRKYELILFRGRKTVSTPQILEPRSRSRRTPST